MLHDRDQGILNLNFFISDFASFLEAATNCLVDLKHSREETKSAQVNRDFEDVFKIFLIYIVCPFCSKILENKNILWYLVSMVGFK